MKSIYDFVVKPVGERYNNTKKVEGGNLILNTEIYNHQYINRVAEVISVPMISDTDILPGDKIITHFNVFRRWHNIHGEEKNSRSYFNEDTYFITDEQIFLYKRKNKWIAPKGYCFIKPLKAKDKFNTNVERPLIGIVKYSDGIVKVGDLIGYRPRTECEFMVDGQRLYRVASNLITIKYEYQGDEEEYNPSWAESS